MLKRKQRFQSLAVILFCSITLSGFTGCGREATFSDEAIRIGIVADIHCGPDQWDKKGTRAIPYLKNFIDEMNKRFLPHAVIELGDKLNNVDVETDARNMEAVKAVFDTIEAPLYYTFGNHEVYTLRKRDVSSTLGEEETFTSFDIGGLHFVILDSQYNPANGSDRYTQKGTPEWMGSGYIPPHELEWLRRDLEKTEKDTIVFCHQPLDEQDLRRNKYFNIEDSHAFTENKKEVREVLENSEKVIVVFQGHTHWNYFQKINGIAYITVPSLVDDSEGGYAKAIIDPESNIMDIDVVGRMPAHYRLDI